MSLTTYHPPTYTYSGLTIMLDRPSRFDTHHLISGHSGNYFDNLLSPLTRFNCEIRLSSDHRPFLPNTNTILLLGQAALERFKSNSGLLTYRGSPFRVTLPDGQSVICLATVTPQDSFDRVSYEDSGDGDSDEGDDGTAADAGLEKEYQKTRRRNFRFWLHHDVRKIVRINKDKGLLRNYPSFNTALCPGIDNLLTIMQTWSNGYLTIDIETDPIQQLTCFSFLYAHTKILSEITDNQLTVYTIPFKRSDGSLFYSHLHYAKLFRELCLAEQRNTVVGHNLSFDLFVLLFKYHFHLPLNLADTMVRHHRLFPEVEKSLGHCISYYTDLPYHKDEGVFDPKNREQELALWQYNAKDVITTFIIFCLQEAYLVKAGAVESAELGCKAIKSCLLMQYEGCLADVEYTNKLVTELDEKLVQYRRILKLLTGRELNAGSWQQVSNYLYRDLGYTKPLKKPTDKENLFKLYNKTHIPSIRVILAYKIDAKRAGSMRKVRLWRNDRFTCAYSVCGTDTMRLSSKELLSFKG